MKRHRYLIFAVGLIILILPMAAVGCAQSVLKPGTGSSDGGNVTNPIPKEYADFIVGPLSIVRSAVSVGETATVAATITNTGGIQGTYTAVLDIDGKQADTKNITVAPGKTEAVSFQVNRNTPGTYKLEIGASAATLSVFNWPYTIQYDMGNPSSELLSVSDGYGHIVRFSPPATPFKIQKISVYTEADVAQDSDWSDKFVTVRIWDSGRTQQIWSEDLPWSYFRSNVGSYWREIQVPNVSAKGDFYVEIVTHSPQFGSELVAWNWGQEVRPAIFMGYDRANPYISSAGPSAETRSSISLMGQPVEIPTKFQGINWFVRVEGDGSL